jgi:hypothetical protein
MTASRASLYLAVMASIIFMGRAVFLIVAMMIHQNLIGDCLNQNMMPP